MKVFNLLILKANLFSIANGGPWMVDGGAGTTGHAICNPIVHQDRPSTVKEVTRLLRVLMCLPGEYQNMTNGSKLANEDTG